MSFDLYVFDVERLRGDGDALADSIGDEAGWDQPLTARLSEFVEQLYPSLLDDTDASPWATWPLTQSVAHGRGCAFNVVWSSVEQMASEMIGLCADAGLHLYDPQLGRWYPPKRRRVSWWRRKGSS